MKLFLVLCLFVILKRSRLVSLVQSGHHLVGNVVTFVCIKDVVACLADDKTILLIFVVNSEEVLNAVAQSVVELVGLYLELIAQALVESLEVSTLLLERCLNAFSLLASVSILLQFLLEIGSSSFQLLLLLRQCVLYVLTFCVAYNQPDL